jgi:hypothetical protein
MSEIYKSGTNQGTLTTAPIIGDTQFVIKSPSDLSYWNGTSYISTPATSLSGVNIGGKIYYMAPTSTSIAVWQFDGTWITGSNGLVSMSTSNGNIFVSIGTSWYKWTGSAFVTNPPIVPTVTINGLTLAATGTTLYHWNGTSYIADGAFGGTLSALTGMTLAGTSFVTDATYSILYLQSGSGLTSVPITGAKQFFTIGTQIFYRSYTYLPTYSVYGDVIYTWNGSSFIPTNLTDGYYGGYATISIDATRLIIKWIANNTLYIWNGTSFTNI